MAKIIEHKTLKKSTIRAISKGNHNTKFIIEAVKCELQYYDFCRAIAELRCEGIVSYRDELKGYYLTK